MLLAPSLFERYFELRINLSKVITKALTTAALSFCRFSKLEVPKKFFLKMQISRVQQVCKCKTDRTLFDNIHNMHQLQTGSVPARDYDACHISWDSCDILYPLNVGVQDGITESQNSTLRGKEHNCKPEWVIPEKIHTPPTDGKSF